MKPDDIRVVPLPATMTEVEKLLARFGKVPPPATTAGGMRWNALGLKPPAR